MGAADAISDVLPPPVRADGPPSAARSDEPSFDDHLRNDANADSAARADRTERPDRSARGERRDDDKQESDDDATTAAQAQAASTAPRVAASPLLTIALAQDGDRTGDGDETPADGTANATAPVAPPAAAPNPNVKAKANTGKSAPAPRDIEPAQADAAPDDQTTLAPIADTPPSAPSNDAALLAAVVNTAPPLTPPPTQTAPSRPTSDRQRAEAAPSITDLATADAKPAATKELSPKDIAPKPDNDVKAQNPKDNFAALLALAQDDARSSDAPSASALTPPAGAPRAEANATPTLASASVAAHAPVASQVGHEIIRKFSGGSTKFEMRLDPPELGRVDVRLEVSRDHKVTAVISADSPQALRELSRNARDLEQSLQSAGLELADDGLSFDLSDRQNAFDQTNQSNGRDTPQSRTPNFVSTDEPSAAPARPLSLDSWRGVRVDLVA